MKSSKNVVLGVLLALITTSGWAQEPSVERWLEQLTVEEKASLVTGQNAWQTREIPRLGIPAVWMADGPVGLRKSTGLEVSDSLPATCFPSAAAMAATWDPALIERLGAGIGTEAAQHQVTLLLAPGLNLKRHPLGGRNFEYYSEDPLLSGKTAAAFVRGVQSRGVGATLKHFAVNNQEHRRMTIDARVDERTMRELYLRGFEIAVKESEPQAVMSAYNRVNGVYASQSRELLTEILRDEWGFAGLVVSDWGAVDDPAASVAAGLDLEMPGNPLSPPQVVAAVNAGTLAEADLDLAVSRVLQLVERQQSMPGETEQDTVDAHHDLAREVAVASMVLLANDGMLPLSAARGSRVGVLGSNAFAPRIQGIGSSQIQPTRLDIPWQQMQAISSRHGLSLSAWQDKYAEDGLTPEQSSELARFFATQDQLVVFAGQKASHDAEAWDRPSMSLAPGDRELIAAARKSGKPFAVVLVGGGAMDLGGLKANALLVGWLGGQALGSAVAQVLFGEATPSGKLSETFALALSDHPSHLNFPSGPRAVYYGERGYVGYRYFQTFGRDVAFPFGHGLSYTTFEYSEASAPATLAELDGSFDVTVSVANVGERPGAETVQVYLRHLDPPVERPDRELVGFAKHAIPPGESRRFTVSVEAERLGYFHEGHGRWVIEPGHYELLVGASAADIRATLPLEVTSGTLPRPVYTVDDVIGDIVSDPRGQVVIDFLLLQVGRRPLTGAAEDDFFAAIFKNMPFKKLAGFSEGKLQPEQLSQLLELVNSDLDPKTVELTLQQAAEQGG
ncbi:MAG: glycoside hydrolase family 3 N-terminal domain-containing protein [Acidobacteriota bacterium]